MNTIKEYREYRQAQGQINFDNAAIKLFELIDLYCAAIASGKMITAEDVAFKSELRAWSDGMTEEQKQVYAMYYNYRIHATIKGEAHD